jgi:hypothetical protein
VNIYEHFFWNTAIFHRKPWAWKVGVGGIGPDLLYLVAFLPRLFSYRSFMEWMHDPLWDTVWSSPVAKGAHSFVIWGGVLLVLRVLFKRNVLGHAFPFVVGWGLHILFDTFTHVSDGYAIFFPLSDYRFPAPVSYWEEAYHGRTYFLVSHSLMAGVLLLWIILKLRRYVLRRRQSG